jgi:type II secretory pathway component GspD/PulD (secretin)
VLKVYQELSRRTVVRSAQLPATKITVESSVPLTLRGALQTLDTALALNGIVMIPQGANHVKAVPEGRAVTEPAPIFDGPWEELPESGSYVTYIVELKEQRAQDVLPILQPLARLPNSILAIPEPEVLVLRDYSINVRQMLNVLRRLEAVRKSQPGRGA